MNFIVSIQKKRRLAIVPSSTILSNSCLSTFLDDSNSDIDFWYFPFCAAERDPITNAGPFTLVIFSTDGMCTAVGVILEEIGKRGR